MLTSSKLPLRTFRDKRLAYLVGLQDIYKEEGYTTKLNGRDNVLEIYPKGADAPKTQEETIIEKWID